MIINKYFVTLEDREGKLQKSGQIIAASKEEAINKARADGWWFREETGCAAQKLKYPLTFKVTKSQ